jgi:hypothetical protein
MKKKKKEGDDGKVGMGETREAVKSLAGGCIISHKIRLKLVPVLLGTGTTVRVVEKKPR